MSCIAPRSREDTRHSEGNIERMQKKDGFVRAVPLHRGQRPACSRGAGFGSCDGSSYSALSGLFLCTSELQAQGLLSGLV